MMVDVYDKEAGSHGALHRWAMREDGKDPDSQADVDSHQEEQTEEWAERGLDASYQPDSSEIMKDDIEDRRDER